MTTAVYHSKQPQEAHYDPETGDYDGQLPNPDLVAQLDPPTPEHLRPIPDNTVKTLFYWAMDLDITQGARMVLLTVIRHVEWADCTGCTASIPTLAREAHLSERSTKGHIKALISDGLISRKRRMNRTCTTDLITKAAPPIGEEVAPPIGEAASPTGGRSGFTINQSSSSTNPGNQSSTPKMSKVKKPETEKKKPQEEEKTETTKERPPRPKKEVDEKQRGTVKTFQALEEEGATGVTNSAPRKTLQEVEEWVEVNMPASPTFLFADAVLKRYKKQWWCPFTGSNPKSGFAKDTPRSTAVEKYMGSPEDWRRLRANLIAKAFQDGGPFPVFDQHDGGNPKLKEPVLCFTCKEMTMAYGEKNTVFNRLEGPDEIDKCDVCLSRQPVAV